MPITNPSCPRCGGQSLKNGFVQGKQQYICRGDCGRKFFTEYAKRKGTPRGKPSAATIKGRQQAARRAMLNNPRCPRCGAISMKGGTSTGTQVYICKEGCGRRFQTEYKARRPGRAIDHQRRSENPPCPRCQGESIKDGRSRSHQAYRCKGECGLQYRLTIKEVRRFEAQRAGAELLPMIERAAASLPPDLREEVAQELAAAVLDGEIDLSNIAAAVPFYRKRINRLSADRWRFVSLDAPISGEEGTTWGERLAG